MQVLVKLQFHISFRKSVIKSSLFLTKMESTSGRTLRSNPSMKNVDYNFETKNKSKNPRVKKENTKNSLSKVKNDAKDIKVEVSETKSRYFENHTILIESDIKLESCESEKLIPSPKKKRTAKAIKDSSIKAEKVAKVKKEVKDVLDIEDCGWKPVNWEKVLENILQMRKLITAPVDTLGCEECPEDGVPPEVFRYQTLISVMLSSQTRDEVTYAATQRLIEHGLTLDNILNTPDDIIGKLIYPAGFWKTKIKFIKNTSQILKDKYGGDIPKTYEELVKLPGVGPKIAHLVMSCAWQETVGIAVDTHVHRISNRLGWVPKTTKTPEQTRKALESWLPKNQWKPINFILVGFGQSICKPIGPSCTTCLNKNLCPYGKTTLDTKYKKKSKALTTD